MKLATCLRVTALLLFGVTVACDPSKPELDKAKQQLQQVTADRDSLKSQLEAAETKITGLQQENTTLKTASAKPAPAEAEAPKLASKSSGKKHAAAAKGHKKRKH